MYVVRRPFRNFNCMMLPGSIVEPGSIKWFKTRLKDRFIVEVNAQNFEQWRAYFKGKHGIDLEELRDDSNAEDTSAAEVNEEPAVPEELAVPEDTAVKDTAKPTVKVVVKAVSKD